MKKALVVLLILAVAGGVFAQINWVGDLRGGMGVVITNEDDAKPTFGLRSVNDGLGARFDLTGTFANADGTAGFRVVLRAVTDGIDMATPVNGHVYPNVYEMWYKLMDGMITIYGGKLDSGGPFGTGGGVDTSLDIGGGAGAFVNVTPMDGFDVRFGIYPAMELTNTAGPEFIDASYRFGVRYLLTDIVDIVALYRLGAANGAPFRQSANDAAIGFKVLALKPMGFSTFNFDFAFMDLMMREKIAPVPPTAYDMQFMTIQMGQNIQYTMGDLVAGVRFLEQLRLFKDDAPTYYAPDLSFSAFVQYLVNGRILPRLDLGFNMGTGIQTGAELRGNWDGLAKGGFFDKASNFVISPTCEFRFGAASQMIKIGYAMQMDLSDPKIEPTMRNTIFASYRVAF